MDTPIYVTYPSGLKSLVPVLHKSIAKAKGVYVVEKMVLDKTIESKNEISRWWTTREGHVAEFKSSVMDYLNNNIDPEYKKDVVRFIYGIPDTVMLDKQLISLIGLTFSFDMGTEYEEHIKDTPSSLSIEMDYISQNSDKLYTKFKDEIFDFTSKRSNTLGTGLHVRVFKNGKRLKHIKEYLPIESLEKNGFYHRLSDIPDEKVLLEIEKIKEANKQKLVSDALKSLPAILSIQDTHDNELKENITKLIDEFKELTKRQEDLLLLVTDSTRYDKDYKILKEHINKRTDGINKLINNLALIVKNASMLL